MWAALVPLIPLLVRIVGKILDKAGANEQEKAETLAVIVAAKDDPLVSIQMKDDFRALRDRLKARKAAAADAGPIGPA